LTSNSLATHPLASVGNNGENFSKQCAHCPPELERNTWERRHPAGVLYSGELAGRVLAPTPAARRPPAGAL